MQQQFQQLYYSQILPHQDVYNGSPNIIANQNRLGSKFLLINIKIITGASIDYAIPTDYNSVRIVPTIRYEQIPVRTIRYEKIPIPKPIPSDSEIITLKAEVEKLNIILKEKNDEIDSWKQKCEHLQKHIEEKKFETIKTVEVPVEVFKVDDRKIRELEEILEEERNKHEKTKKSALKPIEKIVDRPIIVEKIVEVPVDRIVEKIVEKKVPVEVIKYIDKIVERPVEVIKTVDRIVEKRVPVEVLKIDDKKIHELEEENLRLKTNLEEWRIKLIELESKLKESHIQIVEKRVEIPIEVVKQVVEVEKKIEVPTENKIDEKKINELQDENHKLRITLKDWQNRLIEFENNLGNSNINHGKIRELAEENQLLINILQEFKNKINYQDRSLQIIENRADNSLNNDYYIN